MALIRILFPCNENGPFSTIIIIQQFIIIFNQRCFMLILVYQNRYSDTEEEQENVKCLQKDTQTDGQQSIRKAQIGQKL